MKVLKNRGGYCNRRGLLTKKIKNNRGGPPVYSVPWSSLGTMFIVLCSMLYDELSVNS